MSKSNKGPKPIEWKFDEANWLGPVHTGQGQSPLSLYLDHQRMQAIDRGEVLEDRAPGPAVLVGASMTDTFRAPRHAAREKKWQMHLAKRELAWPFLLQDDDPELVEEVRDAIIQVKREMATEKYMKNRPKRIKRMRGPDGRIKGVGIPPQMRKVTSVKQLNEECWNEIDKTRDSMLLEWDAGKMSRAFYEEVMLGAQEYINKGYKAWRKIHLALPLAPLWDDENVTYRVMNRMRKYQEETFLKITYHSGGIPQFYDKPRAPTLAPPKRQGFCYELFPCFQCQYRGLESRCKLINGGCAACQRRGDNCLSINPWDARLIKNGQMTLDKARAWWVENGPPEEADEDMDEEERKEQRQGDRDKRWFLVRRFDVMEWVGGEKGFVKRNEKKDSWALPRFEWDETGKPIAFRS